jgi:hypothetical protein
VMRETKKDLQNGRDEAFLLRHSPRSNSAAVTFDQVRKELVKMLAVSREGAKAVDPTARSFESGRVTGLEDAVKLIDKALQAEASARIKAAVQGKARPEREGPG